jgi:hypothetical protein
MSVIYRVLFFACSITSAPKNVNNGRNLVTTAEQTYLPLPLLSLQIGRYQLVITASNGSKTWTTRSRKFWPPNTPSDSAESRQQRESGIQPSPVICS